MQKDMQWARSRKSVCKRHAAGTDKFNDPPSSAAACLSESERTRLAPYAQLFPGQMGDLGQSPDKRPLVTKSGKLHTIIRNNHLMFDPLMDRRMTPEEVFFPQVWPINAAAIAAAKTSSHFSKCHPVPQSRTRRSALNQVGNAMHITVMGSVMLNTIMQFPCLGRKGPSGPSRQLETPKPEDEDPEGEDAVLLPPQGKLDAAFDRLSSRGKAKQRRLC